MPITVDYSRPFRSHPRRVELIEAVLAADDVDEAGWIEWKTDVDLTATEGQFKLARAILSFANRSTASAAATPTAPHTSSSASHGNQLPGITPMDAADLQQRLQKTFNNNQLGTIFVRHGARTPAGRPSRPHDVAGEIAPTADPSAEPAGPHRDRDAPETRGE